MAYETYPNKTGTSKYGKLFKRTSSASGLCNGVSPKGNGNYGTKGVKSS